LDSIDGPEENHMPVLINEVVAEVQVSPTTENETTPLPQQTPLATAEFEIARILALLEERRQRLITD
jgi:hypothetical protein